jgi:hypothetical protein
MVSIMDLWLPILVSAVFVFLASSILHMVLRYHRSDYSGMPGEDNIMAAMRKEGVARGEYFMPHGEDMAAMKDPAWIAKCETGPVGILTVLPSGPPAMGKQLGIWFVYSVVVGVLVAYVTGRTVPAGAEYLEVHRIAGVAAFLAYAGAQPMSSIWKGQKWNTTIKNIADGLVYALLTAGTFGWLWP